MVILLVEKPLFTWPGLLIVATGIPVYLLWRRAGGPPDPARGFRALVLPALGPRPTLRDGTAPSGLPTALPGPRWAVVYGAITAPVPVTTSA